MERVAGTPWRVVGTPGGGEGGGEGRRYSVEGGLDSSLRGGGRRYSVEGDSESQAFVNLRENSSAFARAPCPGCSSWSRFWRCGCGCSGVTVCHVSPTMNVASSQTLALMILMIMKIGAGATGQMMLTCRVSEWPDHGCGPFAVDVPFESAIN